MARLLLPLFISLTAVGAALAWSVEPASQTKISVTGAVHLNGVTVEMPVSLKAQLSISQGGHTTIDSVDIRTNSEGKFQLNFPKPYRSNTTRTLQFSTLETTDHSSYQLQVDLSFVLPESPYDLGALNLAPDQILASGRYLDADGNAIVNATAELQCLVEDVQNPLVYSFHQLPISSFLIDKDGHFMVKGNIHPCRLRLVLSTPLHSPTVQEFELGAQDLKLRRPNEWKLSGQILLEGFDAEEFHLYLIPEGYEDEFEYIVFSWTHSKDGRFSVDHQTPGTYSLVLRKSYNPFNVITQEIVLGPEGGVLELEPIDLRDTLKKVSLSVKNMEGEEPYHLMAATADGIEISRYSVDGNLEIFLVAPTDIVLYSNEDRCTLLTDVYEDHEVTLRRGYEFGFEVPNPPELPDDWDIDINIMLLSPTGPFAAAIPRFGTGPFPGIYLPIPGTYAIALILMPPEVEEGEEWDWQWIGNESSWPTFEIKDIDEEQVFEIHFAQSDLDEIRKIIEDSK